MRGSKVSQLVPSEAALLGSSDITPLFHNRWFAKVQTRLPVPHCAQLLCGILESTVLRVESQS